MVLEDIKKGHFRRDNICTSSDEGLRVSSDESVLVFVFTSLLTSNLQGQKSLSIMSDICLESFGKFGNRGGPGGGRTTTKKALLDRNNFEYKLEQKILVGMCYIGHALPPLENPSE